MPFRRRLSCNNIWVRSLALKRIIKYIIQIAVNLLLLLIIVAPRETAPSQYVPPPVPKYQVLSASSTKLEIKEAIIEEFGVEMAQIVNCESGFNPKAVNINRNKSKDISVFQINSTHRKMIKEMGYDYDTLTVPQSFEVARKILQIQGKSAWTCHRIIHNATTK